jgi:hypothetical protein
MVADAFAALVTHLEGVFLKMRHPVFRAGQGGADGVRDGRRRVKTHEGKLLSQDVAWRVRVFGLAGLEMLEKNGKRKLGRA